MLPAGGPDDGDVLVFYTPVVHVIRRAESVATRSRSTMSVCCRSSSARGSTPSCGGCSAIRTTIRSTDVSVQTLRKPLPTPTGTQWSLRLLYWLGRLLLLGNLSLTDLSFLSVFSSFIPVAHLSKLTAFRLLLALVEVWTLWMLSSVDVWHCADNVTAVKHMHCYRINKKLLPCGGEGWPNGKMSDCNARGR